MKWYGMNRKITPIWADAGLCEKQTNARLRVDGELQRRNGFASSNVAKQSSAVLALVPIGAASGASLIVMPTGGSVFGYTAPQPSWIDVALKPPIGVITDSSCSGTVSGTKTVSADPWTFDMSAFSLTTTCCHQIRLTFSGSVQFTFNGVNPAPTYFKLYPLNAGIPTDYLAGTSCTAVGSSVVKSCTFTGVYPSYTVTISGTVSGYACGSTIFLSWGLTTDGGPYIASSGTMSMVYSYVPKCNGCGC